MNGIIIKLLVLLFFVSCGQIESPLTVNGHEIKSLNAIRWPAQDFPRTIIASEQDFNDEEKDALLNAAAVWNEQLGFEALVVEFDDTTYTNEYTSGDHYREDHEHTTTRGHSMEHMKSIATTYTTYMTKSKKIVKADVVFNPKKKSGVVTEDNVEVFDLESVMIHELGHFLGMAHSHEDDKESVMNPFLSRGQVKRTLSEEDIANFKALYEIN